MNLSKVNSKSESNLEWSSSVTRLLHKCKSSHCGPQLGVLEENDEFEEVPVSGELAICLCLVPLIRTSCAYVIQRRIDWKDEDTDVSTLMQLSQAGCAASGAVIL